MAFVAMCQRHCSDVFVDGQALSSVSEVMAKLGCDIYLYRIHTLTMNQGKWWNPLKPLERVGRTCEILICQQHRYSNTMACYPVTIYQLLMNLKPCLPVTYSSLVESFLNFVLYMVAWLLCPKQNHRRIRQELWPNQFLGFYPDSEIHGANVGPTAGRQDPGGPHVGHMNLAIWVVRAAFWTDLLYHSSITHM